MKNKMQAIIAMGITSFLLISCNPPKEDVVKVTEPHNIIPVQQAITMKKNYQGSIAQWIEKMNSTQEPYLATEYMYIELDSLKNYISFLEQVEKDNDREISGLRIYFGQYSSAASGFKGEYPGRETVFIAPTMPLDESNLTDEQKQMPKLRNIPFYIRPNSSADKFVGSFEPIDALLAQSDARLGKPVMKTASIAQQQDPSASNSVTTDDGTSLILNELNMAPPPPTKK